MPKRIALLTEQQVSQAEPQSKSRKLFDGLGLYLEVMPTGTKVWRMKFRQSNQKEERLTFVHYSEVSLELARSRRSVARKMLDEGQDPRTEFNAAHMRPPKRFRRRRYSLLPWMREKWSAAQAMSARWRWNGCASPEAIKHTCTKRDEAYCRDDIDVAKCYEFIVYRGSRSRLALSESAACSRCAEALHAAGTRSWFYLIRFRLSRLLLRPMHQTVSEGRRALVSYRSRDC